MSQAVINKGHIGLVKRIATFAATFGIGLTLALMTIISAIGISEQGPAEMSLSQSFGVAFLGVSSLFLLALSTGIGLYVWEYSKTDEAHQA